MQPIRWNVVHMDHLWSVYLSIFSFNPSLCESWNLRQLSLSCSILWLINITGGGPPYPTLPPSSLFPAANNPLKKNFSVGLPVHFPECTLFSFIKNFSLKNLHAHAQDIWNVYICFKMLCPFEGDYIFLLLKILKAIFENV